MIKNIIDMLSISDFYGKTENIDIAKGKYKLDKTVKGIYKQQLRAYKCKRSK